MEQISDSVILEYSLFPNEQKFMVFSFSDPDSRTEQNEKEHGLL